MDYRAYWKGETTQQLSFGQEGVVFKAGGYDDPESAGYLAWLFQPNGDENAYYCEYKDFDIVEEDGINGYAAGTIGAETR